MLLFVALFIIMVILFCLMLELSHPPKDSPRDDLNLLHLVWEHPDRVVGGLGVAVAGLCNALSHKGGVHVEVISPVMTDTESLLNANSYHLNMGVDEALELQTSVEGQLELSGIDGVVADYADKVAAKLHANLSFDRCSVVHAHDWMTAAAGVNVKLVHGVPLILHVHSTQVDREGAHAKGAVYEHEKWAMEQADVIIAVSAYAKRVIIENYGISADKIRVVMNASGASSYGEERLPMAPLSIQDVVEKKTLVVFAGRLVGQKCPEMAVEIMVGALRKVEGACGVIAGGGDRLHAIRDLVRFKGMGDRIEVLGNVPQANMATIYHAATVLILPSMSEPFGLVALEAARQGVAVMVSDRCGVSELLESAKVTDLYNVDGWVSGLVELIENPILRDEQVRKQLLEVESYDWSDAGDAVLGIVDELLVE